MARCIGLKKLLLLTLHLIIINPQLSISEVRYVSKTGSSTPPYTSWITAADSIQKCINISNFGDTIYVANGVYKEKVVMIPGLSLIGGSMDSCVIDTRTLVQPTNYESVMMKQNCLFMFFRVVVSKPHQYYGSAIFIYNADSISIRYNVFESCSRGIYSIFSTNMIENNIFYNTQKGMDFEDFDNQPRPLVQNNILREVQSIGVLVAQGSEPLIINNHFYSKERYFRAFIGGGSDSAFFIGNLIVCEGGLQVIANANLPTLTHNNTLFGKNFEKGILSTDMNDIRNNIVVGGKEGFQIPANRHPVLKHNNAWDNEPNYAGITPDSTNISVDPMFVNPDSNDFHLQMYSPLIDRGDPNILDVDGTRSDIGYYGGPYGESYTYKDYAPKPPKGLKLYYYDGVLALNWKPNEEADFKEYYLYRDTTANFTADSSTLINRLQAAYFFDTPSVSISRYYFKLMAADSQGNISKPSEEIGIIFTSAEEEAEPLIVQDYALYTNYPNPFNPSTIIPFRLKDRGYVKLTVFDLKGETTKTLVNEYLEAGYHEVEFKAESKRGDIASGIYFYRLEVVNYENKIAFIDIKKMLMIK